MTLSNDATNLLNRLLNLNDDSQVNEFLSQIKSVHEYKWVGLGFPYVPEAAGLVNAQPDPIKALIDRIDNMHDAVIEKHKPRNPGSEPGSPREAVTKWLGLSSDLSSEDDRTLGKLAGMAQVLFVLTSKSGFPTVKFRDLGIGCVDLDGKLDLGSTILSLLRGNKARKKYVVGVFGFGGSTTFWHCNYSVIISRPDPSLGIGDDVTWTIVRKRPPVGDEKRDQIEYLVWPDNRCPVVDGKDVPTEVFQPGTYVAHIEFNLKTTLGASRLIVTQSDMLFQRFRYHLFNTVFPFMLDAVDQNGQPIRGRDQEGRVHSQKRNMSGALRILKRRWNDEKVKRRDEREQILFHSQYVSKDGLIIRYWIFNVRRPEADKSKEGPDRGSEQKQKSPYISRYLDTWHRRKGDPIILTINGRTHFTFPMAKFREFDLNLLEGYLLIQIDCDGMNWNARRDVYNQIDSTRSNVKPELNEMLTKELKEALGRDNRQLWEIVDFLQDKILSQASEDTKIGKVLRKIILNYETKKSGIGEHIVGKGPLPTIGHAGTTIYHPNYIPSILEFDDYPDPIEVEIGSKRILQIRTDAPDDILERREDTGHLEILWLGETRFSAICSPPSDGVIQIHITAPNEVDLGHAASLKAKLTVTQVDQDKVMETETVNLVAARADRPEYKAIDPPSRLDIASKTEPLKLKKGRITSIVLEFDGPDDLFERDVNRGQIEGFCTIERVEPLFGRRGPYSGRMTVHVEVPENMSEGVEGLLTYRTKASGIVLETSRRCIVVPYRKKLKRYGQPQQDEKVANVKAEWVHENDDQWIRFGWTREKHVARAEIMPNGMLVIWVSRHYDRLRQFWEFRRKSVQESQAKTDLERYKMQIAYYAWQRQKGGQNDSDETVQEEYARVAETTLIGLLPLDQVTLF